MIVDPSNFTPDISSSTEPEKKDNVSPFPIKPKPRLEEDKERFLVVEHRGCLHRGGFTLNESEECITCKLCGEKLNPMYALKMLANQETRWHETRARYKDEMKRLDERSRTCCQHCGKITKISKS